MRLATPLALLAAFVTSLSLSLFGCLTTDCECPEVPVRPVPEPPLESLVLIFEDPETRVVRPAGSVTVSESEIVIDYDADGTAIHVRYEVQPH